MYVNTVSNHCSKPIDQKESPNRTQAFLGRLADFVRYLDKMLAKIYGRNEAMLLTR